METESASGVPCSLALLPRGCQPSPGETITTVFMALRTTMGGPCPTGKAGPGARSPGGIYTYSDVVFRSQRLRKMPVSVR